MYRAGLPAMRGRFRRRWIGLLAALLLLWTGTARAQDALVGQLLIASPQITQAVFTHTVILIVQHTDQGALGIVINQPFEQKTIASLLADIGKKDDSVQGSIDVFAGGPMEPGVGFIVHSIDYHRAETQPIDSHIALTASTEVLRDMGHGKGPKKSLVAFGYAGWGPGQLEVELARHDDDRKKVWDDAMARRGQPL
jgi:putative transcriptional regulator